LSEGVLSDPRLPICAGVEHRKRMRGEGEGEGEGVRGKENSKGLGRLSPLSSWDGLVLL